MKLTNDQEEGILGAVEAVRMGTLLYRISGYAGTGKTTCICEIMERLACEGLVGAACAYTGKAASRLMEKGVDHASTIHSLIYTYNKNTGNYVLKDRVDAAYIIIDEASMISHKLWCDVQSFGIPIILIGDPAQLEPIGDDPNLMLNVDYKLTEIHRQAKTSSIITLATTIRESGEIPITNDDEVVVRRGYPNLYELLDVDIVLCGFNKTRIRCNDHMRRGMGRKKLIEPDERLIILMNDSNFGVFNGMMVIAQEELKSTDSISTWRCTDAMGKNIDLPFAISCIKAGVNNMDMFGVAVCATYGYAITVHKSQGSEWDNVLVMDEQWLNKWDPDRWRYTAVTRAAKKLTYYI